jgi:Tol biopolymer transport system component
LRRVLLALALAACSRKASPPRAQDAAPPVKAVPDARREEPPRAAIPDAEREALAGSIEAAVGREGAFRVAAIDPRTGKTQTLSPDDGASYFPVPGARSIAIRTVDRGGDHVEQLVLLPDTPLGPAATHIRSPTVHADQIVFESDSQSFRDLYLYDIASKELRRLTDDRAGNFEPSLSPDGTNIAYTSSRDGDTEIYRMTLTSPASQRLTFFHKDDWAPAYGGEWIAFLSDREGVPRLFVVRADGTGTRRLHDSDPGGEESPGVWSPDGTRVAYTVSTRDGASEVWWADVATGTAHRVSAPGARDEVPAWSPDGDHLVYVSTRDRRIDLWLARADGTAESRLTDTPEEEWIPRFRP